MALYSYGRRRANRRRAVRARRLGHRLAVRVCRAAAETVVPRGGAKLDVEPAALPAMEGHNYIGPYLYRP